MARLILFSLLLLMLASASDVPKALTDLAKLFTDGLLTREQFEAAKEASIKLTNDSSPTNDGEAAAILRDLGLGSLVPVFKQNRITTKRDLLLLDDDSMTKYLGIDLVSRLRLADYIRRQKKKVREAPEGEAGEAEAATCDRNDVAALFADLVAAHGQKAADARRLQEAVSHTVARAIDDNNAVLMRQMRAMVADAVADASTPARARRELQQAPGGAALRSLNAESASLWLEDDAGSIALGADADVSLRRARAGVLATESAFQLGAADGDACEAGDAGTLRWSAVKSALQVCDGAKWKTAGGAVLDAAEDEPCDAENNVGALRWHNNAGNKRMEACDGSGTDGGGTWAGVLTGVRNEQYAALASSAVRSPSPVAFRVDALFYEDGTGGHQRDGADGRYFATFQHLALAHGAELTVTNSRSGKTHVAVVWAKGEADFLVDAGDPATAVRHCGRFGVGASDDGSEVGDFEVGDFALGSVTLGAVAATSLTLRATLQLGFGELCDAGSEGPVEIPRSTLFADQNALHCTGCCGPGV